MNLTNVPLLTQLDSVKEYLPFIIPLIILQFALLIFALIHIFRHKEYRFGNRTLWVILVIVFQTIGPILYFLFGRNKQDD